MVQTSTLTPHLTVLLPQFRDACTRIRDIVGTSSASTETIAQLRSAILSPLSAPTKAQLAEELTYVASLSVVIDLVAQGWKITSTVPSVTIEFTNGLTPDLEKERIRRGHLMNRGEQLTEPSVKAFVTGMEKQRLTPKGWHSIFSLMRDGGDLAGRLAAAQVCPEKQLELMRDAIQPYIQFVDRDGVCEHTGLRLNDIWRYFRHTWVNSYKSVPGRSMMILVRDAAAPNHPVIGIACLASSVVQQSCRDQWIGWDPDSAIGLLRASPKKHAAWLLNEVDKFIGGLYLRDLLRESIITRSDVKKPRKEVIERLLEDSEKAIKHHRLYPNASQHKSISAAATTEWRARAETSLFRSKRSKQLATLLSIRATFQEAGLTKEITGDKWRSVFDSSRFRHAVSQVVRLVKAERVGINMMDITVCGAVAPYNLLLGGKLVCFLLCSPEVVKEYRRRYKAQASLIASSMRGETVLRDAQLVLLCTTSLYGSSLSQYSRVKIPAERVGGKVSDAVAFERVGLSEGFGSFQFSKETLRLMGALLGQSRDARKVNSIFGEGVNPLMRKIREALTKLGLPADVLLKHGNKRVVYGIPLATNFKEVLLGLSAAPKFCFPMTRAKERSVMLAEHWRERWLGNRLRKAGILEEVAHHTVVYPIRHGAQVKFPEILPD
jgi:hypothetical protein